MKPVLALVFLILPTTAPCQRLPSVDAFLDRLDAYAKHYEETLPSLACDEQITSQALNKKGKVTWEVKTQSSLREIRTDNPYDPFVEKREFKIVNGHRAKVTFQPSQMPYFVVGGFAELAGFKGWQERDCFDYSLTPEQNGQTVRLEMSLKGRLPNPSCRKIPEGFRRIVIAEPDTGRILHVERTIAPGEAEMNSEAYFGGIDYAPQTLGDRTFWLPSRFYAHDAHSSARMSVSYSNYHRYTGELKIVPNGSPSGAEQSPH